ncbi:MAG: PIG-L family deacetylase [Lentisphaerae bacterium]|nr:PIG-L family deacetylase [Lentisphaerota bacterium]
MNNPYQQFVAGYARLVSEQYPMGKAGPGRRVIIARDAPQVLLFSPHPDDECITGALPLRLERERKMNVINVVVTQGSRHDRQAERLAELRQACDYLGFGVLPTAKHGLEKINPANREQNPAAWAEAVAVIAGILRQRQPRLIFVPHEKDWNTTHIGTHYLVNDALKIMPISFCCGVVETEFWAPMLNPNLMIESSVADVTDLVTALSFHVGEVSRNPYHLRLPAWLQDNVRRGGELVGGQGTVAPTFVFATLYRFRVWARGKYKKAAAPGKFISCNDRLGDIFG